MMIEEKLNCYKTGALNPEETQIAIGAFEKFAKDFQKLYDNAEPLDSTIAEIFLDLAADFTFEFFRLKK